MSGAPRHCSGDMYAGVPMIAPAWVRAEASVVRSLAIPKSRIFTRSPPMTSASGTRNTFSGLRSRWTMPLACAAASVVAIWRARRRASRIGSGPRASRVSSDSPCRNSMTRKALPSLWWPKSNTATMPGSTIAVAARASLKNRMTTSGRSDRLGCRTLIAACRPSRQCSPR
jgi:hypothetical protein